VKGDTMKSVLITGASTGIGRACAEHLAANGWQVFGSVRKQADADALNSALAGRGEALLFDVTDRAAMEQAASQLAERLDGRRLQGLVNNAGIALPGPALLQPEAEMARVLDINFLGMVRAVQVFAPLLGTDPARTGAKGRIVNITSVSGKFGYPFTAAYVASKHAVEGFSESLRRELMLDGIDLIVVGPGAVKTPIWDKGQANDLGRYEGSRYAPAMKALATALAAMDAEGLEPVVVARTVEQALSAARPKVRYAPVPNPLVNWWAARLLPKRMVDRFVGEQLGLVEKPTTKA
jgi:NAD(P)-dependent dehydrogenase (short-subunit alcohol dehydrogenase family)